MGKHTPADQQRRLVALWERSTLSKAAFARFHDVPAGTFAAWVARHREVAAPPVFVQVSATVDLPAPTTFAVRLDDRALAFDAPPPPAWFAAVLRELAAC